MRTVKQSSVVRETENGEEGEDEAAEFGEDLKLELYSLNVLTSL